MMSLCLAYKTNYPVVRARHRQHETSPSTLLRSTNRPRSHRSTRGINAAIDENRAIDANDRDEQQQRSVLANAGSEPTIAKSPGKPTRTRGKPTNPDHNFSTSHHKITYDSHEGHSKYQS